MPAQNDKLVVDTWHYPTVLILESLLLSPVFLGLLFHTRYVNVIKTFNTSNKLMVDKRFSPIGPINSQIQMYACRDSN